MQQELNIHGAARVNLLTAIAKSFIVPSYEISFHVKVEQQWRLL